MRIADILRAAFYLPSIAHNWLLHRLFSGSPAWRKTMLRVHCEQSPLSASNITLADERDDFGMFRTRIDWRISPHEIESIRTFVRLAKKIFEQCNLAHIDTPPGFFIDNSVVLGLCSDSNHHMGSMRMSRDPEKGIVDPDLRLHGIANGYVLSSSVFRSCGFSNPTHTVLALALRLADKLIADTEQDVPAATPAEIAHTNATA
jgi:choline dehydrogenase-like flavoprotein